MAKIETFEEMENQFNERKNLALETSRAVAGTMGYLRRSQLRGSKFSRDEDDGRAR